jgi:hypothetical protein
MRRLLLAATLLLPLTACGMPTPFSVATFVLDVGTYAASGKTTTDLALSAVAGEDCQVIRVLEGDPCLSPDDYELALGVLEPLSEEATATRLEAPAVLYQVAAIGTLDANGPGGLQVADFLSDDVQPGTRAAATPAGMSDERIEVARFVSDDLRPDRAALPATQLSHAGVPVPTRRPADG